MSHERIAIGRPEGRFPVILCADDYGLAPGVGAGIRELLALDRLSATGCMTISPHWPAEGMALRPYRSRADLGLHLTLTDFEPLGPMPSLAPSGRLPALPQLLRRAFLGQLDHEEIAAEVDRQIDRFEAAIGSAPAFLDGHQHVHLLPIVRAIVLDRCVGRLSRTRPYVRSCVDSPSAILARGVAPMRALVINALGRGLAADARRAGVRTNSVFRGVRSFGGHERYRMIFPRFLTVPVPRMLIACHPGRVDRHLEAVDPVTAPREDELHYFLSDLFPRALDAAGVILTRLGADG